MAKAGAKETFGNVFEHFVKTRVSSEWCIMRFFEDEFTKGSVIWDKNARRGFTGNNQILMELKTGVERIVDGGMSNMCLREGDELYASWK